MSGAFATMGLLVLAGFALGLFVGWLTWRSEPTSAGEATSPSASTQAQRRPMTQGLPDWQVRQLPVDEDEPAERRPGSGRRSETTDATIVIGSQGLDSGDRAKPRSRRR